MPLTLLPFGARVFVITDIIQTNLPHSIWRRTLVRKNGKTVCAGLCALSYDQAECVPC